MLRKSTFNWAALTMVTLATGCGSAGNDTGAESTGSGSGSCLATAKGHVGNKITALVSWPESIGVEAGQAEVVIWTKAELAFDGNDVAGTVQPCGSVVPPLQTKKLIGGMKIQPIIADAVWDAPGIPHSTVAGTISGFGPGATLSMKPVGTGVGAELADPINDAWPSDWRGVTTNDPEADGNPGVSATPNTSAGFAAPPLDINPAGPRAELLFLATRTVIELEGVRDSCTTASGKAIVHAFDNHVVGCKATGAVACTDAQVDFVDGNRVIYKVESATYQMKQVAEGASCADVRAALP